MTRGTKPPLRVGVLTFQALPHRELRDDVRFAESIGIHSAWLADQAVPEQVPLLEAWTSLASLAADTKRIRIGTRLLPAFPSV